MDFTKTIKTLKLLLATVLVGTASLSANAATTITFQDESSGLYFSASSSKTTCSVIAPTDGTYSNDSYVIPSIVTYNDTEYSVVEIGSSAFNGCASLTSVTVPESVTFIGESAFEGCTALSSITIPESVTYIGRSTFSGCTALSSITIPESVTSIGSSAFRNCTALSKVNISNVEAWCKISFKSYESNPLYFAHHLYLNGDEITNLVIPESITQINDYAFYGGSAFTSVTIPESVTAIGNSAFSNCTALSKVNISNVEAWCKISFKSYESNPLYFAHHLYLNGEEITDLVIPESITKINDYAFYGCSAFTSVTIPNSVISIGNNAFDGCTSLTSIIIPEGVTSIGRFTFGNCTSLTSVTIPNSVTSISYGAFSSCTSLTSITIPEGVTTIGGSAFYGCSSLTSANIPESVTSIGSYAFERCTALTSITIPDNVKAIETGTFYYCTSLASLDLGEGVETIGFQAFENCNSLKGTYTNQFTGEYQYVLIIPNSVKTIDKYAFEKCNSLDNIWIGDGCTSIGDRAFNGCYINTSVSCMAYPAPIIATRQAFDDYSYVNAYLYIPGGATKEETQAIYDDYVAQSNYWRLFLKSSTSTYGSDGNNGISVGVDEVANEDIAVTTDGKAIEITGYEGEVNVYNVAGMRVYQGSDNRIELPNEGIYVVIVNGKSYKVGIK